MGETIGKGQEIGKTMYGSGGTVEENRSQTSPWTQPHKVLVLVCTLILKRKIRMITPTQLWANNSV